MGCLHCIYTYYFIETYKEIGQEHISDESLTFIGSFGGICVTVMRIFGGFLLDRFKIKDIYSVIAILLLFQIATVDEALKSTSLYAISCITLMSIEGIIVVILPTICLNTFGMRRGPTVYSFLNAYSGAASFIMILLIQTVKPIVGIKGLFATFFTL